MLKECFASLRDDIGAYTAVSKKDNHVCEHVHEFVDPASCKATVERLVEMHKADPTLVFGCDMEWSVSQNFYESQQQAKVETVQIATELEAYVFCLDSIMSKQHDRKKFPTALAGFLEDDDIQLVGHNIKGDTTKLNRDYGVFVRGTIQLADEANKALSAAAAVRDEPAPGKKAWNLSQLSRRFTTKDVNKFAHLQKSTGWGGQLDKDHLTYAGTDAMVHLLVWNGIKKMNAEIAANSSGSGSGSSVSNSSCSGGAGDGGGSGGGGSSVSSSSSGGSSVSTSTSSSCCGGDGGGSGGSSVSSGSSSSSCDGGGSGGSSVSTSTSSSCCGGGGGGSGGSSVSTSTSYSCCGGDGGGSGGSSVSSGSSSSCCDGGGSGGNYAHTVTTVATAFVAQLGMSRNWAWRDTAAETDAAAGTETDTTARTRV